VYLSFFARQSFLLPRKLTGRRLRALRPDWQWRLLGRLDL